MSQEQNVLRPHLEEGGHGLARMRIILNTGVETHPSSTKLVESPGAACLTQGSPIFLDLAVVQALAAVDPDHIRSQIREIHGHAIHQDEEQDAWPVTRDILEMLRRACPEEGKEFIEAEILTFA